MRISASCDKSIALHSLSYVSRTRLKGGDFRVQGPKAKKSQFDTTAAAYSIRLDLRRKLKFNSRCAEFGDLPLVQITFPIATIRPADDLIIQSTELSGMSAFEEVIDINSLVNLRDPAKERLIELLNLQSSILNS